MMQKRRLGGKPFIRGGKSACCCGFGSAGRLALLLLVGQADRHADCWEERGGDGSEGIVRRKGMIESVKRLIRDGSQNLTRFWCSSPATSPSHTALHNQAVDPLLPVGLVARPDRELVAAAAAAAANSATTTCSCLAISPEGKNDRVLLPPPIPPPPRPVSLHPIHPPCSHAAQTTSEAFPG
jgi:hypothetical protein